MNTRSPVMALIVCAASLAAAFAAGYQIAAHTYDHYFGGQE